MSSPFVSYATEVAKGSMELLNDVTKIITDVISYPVRIRHTEEVSQRHDS